MPVQLSDLVNLASNHPQGSVSEPNYVFGGGSAIQSWLGDKANSRRLHHDIDLYVFQPLFFQKATGINLDQTPFFTGFLSQSNISTSALSDSIPIEASRDIYYDAEVIPALSDIRLVTVNGASLLALSPEFVAVSKLSYPNVHRLKDFEDILELNQQECLADIDRLSALLSKTSLSKLVTVPHIVGLISECDIALMIESIQRQLIGRFLFWDRVNVSMLSWPHVFVLLDLNRDVLDVPEYALKWIDMLVDGMTTSKHELNRSKLGLHLIVMGLSEYSPVVLQDRHFQALIHRWLPQSLERPSYWLARCKTLLRAFRQIHKISNLLGEHKLNLVLSSDIISRVFSRICFDDPSRFVFLALLTRIYQDLLSERVASDDCLESLRSILSGASTINYTAPHHLLLPPP